MNKSHFQSMFSATSGYIYNYVGEATTAEITAELLQLAGTSLISVVVTNTQMGKIVYTSYPELIDSENFKMVTDLTPDPIIEEVVVEEVPADPAPEGV